MDLGNQSNIPSPEQQGSSQTWYKLKKLKQSYDQGDLSTVEFKNEKKRMIDRMTGTKRHHSKISGDPDSQPLPRVPDFSKCVTENGIKHEFNPETLVWTKKRIQIKIEKNGFAKGTMRSAHHMIEILDDLNEKEQIRAANTEFGNQFTSYVVKIALNFEDGDRETYFSDVEMQMYARQWATKFNELNPPKKIHFIKAWVLELVDRPSSPICGVEKFIRGSFYKFNNNAGYVSRIDRNTPQAFSHFTYEASKHDIIICDIQGVGDCYTDPQIHCVSNSDAFGLGNGAQEGIRLFLKTHKCNSICRYLKLPSINAKAVDTGTVVNSAPISGNVTEISPILLPYKTYENSEESCCKCTLL